MILRPRRPLRSAGRTRQSVRIRTSREKHDYSHTNLLILRFFARRVVVRGTNARRDFEFKFLHDFREAFAIKVARSCPDCNRFCGREPKNVQGFSGTLFPKRGALRTIALGKSYVCPCRPPGEDPLTKDRSSSFNRANTFVFS